MVAWYDENEDVPIAKMGEAEYLEALEKEKNYDKSKIQSFEEQERIVYAYMKKRDEDDAEEFRCGMPIVQWTFECTKAFDERDWKRLSYLWEEDYTPRFIAKCKRLELMYENR